MIILGVDCGLSGALAFMRHAETILSIEDMPVFEVARGEMKRRDLDGHKLARLIGECRPGHAFVEQAQAMPRQSAYASGIFFQSYGEVRGVLIALGIPLTIVHPRTWKKALGVPAEKDGARARASQLLPSAAGLWPLKKHDGRAEAALIALYGLRQIGLIATGGEAP